MDKNGRFFLLDVTNDEQNFVLANLYNDNTEKDQLNTIHELTEISESVNNISAKQIILGGDFDLYFYSLLKSQGGNPILKKSIAKMIELQNTFELCYIWRLRNPKIKKFTFRKNHRTDFIQFRLLRPQNCQTYIATFLTHLNTSKHVLEILQVVLVKFNLMKSWNIKLFLMINFIEL